MTTTTPISSVVHLDVDGERSWWELEKDGIGAALAEHYGGEIAVRR